MWWMCSLVACGLALPNGSDDAGSAPQVPPGTRLVSGVAATIEVDGDLSACGIDAVVPKEITLDEGPKNGPFSTFALRMDPPTWSAWDHRPAMDLMSMPPAMAKLAEAELGRPLAAEAAYGIAGGYEEEGEGCRTRLYVSAVEPLLDGWQITEVLRTAPTPRSGEYCGLDREALAKVAPCGKRVIRVHGVKAPERGGPLTPAKLLAVTGLARGFAEWAPTEQALIDRIGPPTRIDGKDRIWAVRDGEACVYYAVEKGWPAAMAGDKVDPAERVGTVVEPYRAVPGAPYYDECRAATGT